LFHSFAIGPNFHFFPSSIPLPPIGRC
jgi:hypothetical protein